jgi:aminopeptidase
MADPRLTKLAKVLINYSLALQPQEQFILFSSPLAQDLALAVYKEALLAGAYVDAENLIPGQAEIFYKVANDDQLARVSPLRRLVTKQYDALLEIGAFYNTRELSAVDPARQAQYSRTHAELNEIFRNRAASGDLKWCLTLYPTNASAQEADMSLSDFEEFVYGAGLLDLDDPVAAWQEVEARQQAMVDWLAGKDQVILKGSNIDLRLSIKDRSFINACGRRNFPDGEIFTSPVEASVEGWVRFGYPAIFGGREITDIELWFEEGKIVKETAGKGQESLTAALNTDQGSRYMGEWGIGTNYGIQRFTKNMLFDEKMGGTIHLAMGMGFPEAGSQNSSSLHWDMLCDMAESEITAGGELFYKDGQIVI